MSLTFLDGVIESKFAFFLRQNSYILSDALCDLSVSEQTGRNGPNIAPFWRKATQTPKTLKVWALLSSTLMQKNRKILRTVCEKRPKES